MTIDDIIHRAKGDEYLAYRLGITSNAIFVWRKRGIPQKHWKQICTLAKCAPSDIYAANQVVRKDWKPRGGKQNA